jgi:UDP-4-amino-4,6-dideoxy-L-N-acetyl-beta-L-altrosamine transaminase
MINYSQQSINQDDIDSVINVLKSSHLTQGKEVREFEKELANYIGVKHAITFNSATSALLAAYHTAGITKGDEVITSPISFVATSNMLLALGAKPVFCDVKLDGNIDERFIERLITPKTKAIVPVHFSGNPVEIEKITAIAKKHNLIVIEDAAHALGSSIKGKKIGSISPMSIFSFHAIKSITTGEGGCVMSDSDEYAEKLRLFASHGIQKKAFWNSDMIQMGYNFRLTDIAAALGRSQLKRLDIFIAKRAEIAAYYDKRFKNHKLFATIKVKEQNRSAYHLYPIILTPTLHCPKEDIYTALHEKGIGVQIHYRPIYQNSYYKERFGEISLHVSNDFYRSELSIPCHQQMSLDDAKYVADTLLEILEKYSYRACSF